MRALAVTCDVFSGSIELGEFVRVLIDFREGKITGTSVGQRAEK